MKNIFLISFFILMPLLTNAQNYKNGYIITNNNDIVKGFIDYRTDKSNSNTCHFKENMSAETKSYHPGEIKGYRLLNEKNDELYYVSKELNINNSKQIAFVEFLLEGVMNLYYYSDGKSRYYLFEDENKQMSYITKEENQLAYDNKDKLFSIEDKKYKGELKYKFKDIPAVAKMTDQTDFNHKSMIKLAKAYHDLTCTTGEECIVFEGKGNKQILKVKFSVYAGITYLSSYKIFDRIVSAKDYDMKKYSPSIGGQINIYAPRWTQSLGLILDLSISRLKGERPVYNSEELTNIYKINSLIGSYKGGIRYTYPKGRYKPNLEIGYTYNMVFNNDTKFINITNGKEVTHERAIANKYTGLYLAAGVDFQLQKDNYIFCRITYDKNWYRDTGSHGIDLFGSKVGYTF